MNKMNLPEKHCNDLKFKHFTEKSYYNSILSSNSQF